MDSSCSRDAWNTHLGFVHETILNGKQTVEVFVSDPKRVPDFSTSDHALLKVCRAAETKDKETAGVDNRLWELRHSEVKSQSDFAKKLEAVDRELEKAKRILLEAERNVREKVAEVQRLHQDFRLMYDADKHDKKEETQEKLETSNDQKRGLETRLFNGKDYFKAQPSWFDSLSDNTGRINVQFKEKTECQKEFQTAGNTSHRKGKAFPERIKAEDYFELQPSWFDTLLTNVGCLDVKFNPVPREEAAFKKQSHTIYSTSADVYGQKKVLYPKKNTPSPIVPATSDDFTAAASERTHGCLSANTCYLFSDSE
ncbi:hypothetical protein ACROYT_G014533 [Oculina patagonica]